MAVVWLGELESEVVSEVKELLGVNETTELKCRIYDFHKAKSEPNCTPTRDLPVPTFVQTDCIDAYGAGDIVAVGLRYGDPEQPYVLGKINNVSGKHGTYIMNGLTTLGETHLSSNTSIGDVEWPSIEKLRDLQMPLQQTLLLLKDRDKWLYDALRDLHTKLKVFIPTLGDLKDIPGGTD